MRKCENETRRVRGVFVVSAVVHFLSQRAPRTHHGHNDNLTLGNGLNVHK